MKNTTDYYSLLLNKLKEPTITPLLISRIYRRAIVQINKNYDKWKIVNEAICNKWDFETLEHIKGLAWRTRKNKITTGLAKLLGIE